MASRVAASGRSTRILRGIRRRTASSRSKGRFVEPMTTTRSPDVRRPSHSCISVVFTDVSVPWAVSSPDSREARRESISSMKMTQGANLRASANTAFAFFSDSPSHLSSIVEASTARNAAPPSVATAFARSVLPVPGGPNRSTPLTAPAATPSAYSSGYLSGNVMASRSAAFAWSRPPMESNVTLTSDGWTTCCTSAFSCFPAASVAASPAGRTAPGRSAAASAATETRPAKGPPVTSSAVASSAVASSTLKA
mmetsp:Transcript_16866/g.58698  ORF Transcript_16866/g.58698 Transcript_16866/m.58698 type:complete len:253 (+) Transcript_16866:474-1232(+)